jgi:hypothetical protein
VELLVLQAWAELDPQGTNYIPAIQLGTLISQLDPPVGVKGEEGGSSKLQGIVMSIDIPIRNNQVSKAVWSTPGAAL